jgi:hypothetical protein
MASEQAPEQLLTCAETRRSQPVIDPAENLWRPVAPGERSCCCASRPAVRVVLPASAQRDHPVDLLLCRHHFLRSEKTIKQAGARIFDPTGALMSAVDPAPAR